MTTDQLALDFSLPVDECTVQQSAVVFTALGGDHEGQLTYQTGNDEWLQFMATEWLPEVARKLGKTCDARLMTRTVTCGPWEAA